MAVDDSGNVYVSCSVIDSQGSPCWVTIKYDPNGDEDWVAEYFVFDPCAPPTDIGVDSEGNVYVTGAGYAGSAAIIKYDSNGNLLWEDYTLNTGWALCIDSFGYVYVTGEDWEGFATAIKYNTDGNKLWAARYGSGPWIPGYRLQDVALDDLGNVYVTSYNRTVKYSPNGKQRWLVNDGGVALAVDSSANVYMTGYGVTLKYAQPSCVRPGCGVRDVPRDAVLCWKPGQNAVTYDVYFGTNEGTVTDANRANPLGVLVSQDYNDTTYDPCGLLELDTTYYWRIDEVNLPSIWKGDVWCFRTANYLIVDDFESYASNVELQEVWYGYDGYVYLERCNPCFVRSGHSMKYQYSGDAEVVAETTGEYALPSGIGPDWTEQGVKALVLHFYGDPNNDADVNMYVALAEASEGPPHAAQVTYGDNGENTNDLKDPNWHEWNIDLADFDSCGVDLTNVQFVYVGFNGTPDDGDDVVYFDDIRLYIPRCIREKPTADLNWDCVVNFRDFAVLANEWLDMGCCEADLYKDNKVDFKDFAILADGWLEEGQLFP
jgi:hypothetical protein